MASPRGAVFLCNRERVLKDVIEDRLNLFPGRAIGQPIDRLFDSGSSEKLTLMFDRLVTSGAEFDWELDLKAGTPYLETIRLAAGVVADQIVVAATPSGESLAVLLGDMTALSNEYVDGLRALMNEHPHQDRLLNTLNALTEVNNEMAVLQRELSRKNRLLEEAIVRKNEVLGMVAHDLRGPLHGISMSANVLRINTDENGETVPRHVDAIVEAVRVMSHLVENTLDHAAIEMGTLQLARTPVDVAAATRTLLELYREHAKKKGVALKLDGASAPLVVNVDRSKFEQIVSNLVNNAIKYCPEGTTVQVSMRLNNGALHLMVSDDGPGIDPDKFDSLFQAFQGGSQGSLAERGIGLGLTIVKKMIEGHGGRLDVDSSPDTGSAFTVSLPAVVVT